MSIFGYARVSTDGQKLDAQVKELKVAGAKRLFQEKASGAAADRRQLRRAINEIESGDVLIVTRLDRLARPQSASIVHPRRMGTPVGRIPEK